MGQISSVKIGADGNFGGGLAFFTPAGIGNTFSERMRITNIGNVGINTTNPTATLHVSTDTGVLIKGATSNSDAILSFLPTTGGRQYDFRNFGSNFAIVDSSANITRMFFNFSGNTGIGTTTPQASLHVSGTSGGVFEVDGAASVNALYVSASGDVGIGKIAPNARLDVSGSVLISGSLTTTGNITATTLVVQTVTSSVSFITGSTRFGSLASNTHQFTGSILLTGSMGINVLNPSVYGNIGLAVSGSATNSIARVAMVVLGPNNGLNIGDDLTDVVMGPLNSGTKTHILSRAGGVYTRALTVDSAGFVGIGTTSPGQLFEVVGGEIKAGRVDTTNEGGQVSFGRSTDNATAWYIDAFGNVASPQLRFVNVTNSVVAMTITGSNVGIGTSNPSAILDVRGASIYMNISDTSDSRYINFGNWVAGRSQIEVGAGDFFIKTQSSNYLAFGTNASERMRITSAGKLCVNRTATIFTSSGNVIQADVSSGGEPVLEVYNQNLSDSAPAIGCFKNSSTTSSSARFIQFYSNGGTQAMGGIVGNGATNVQFASISDIREKENITSINGSLNKILLLNPVEFDWLKTGEHIKAGFVAQQVEEVFPEYVVENMSNDSEEERKGLTGGLSSGIIAHLVKAIQEQQTIITSLQARVQELENK
jgi:hypothetical protein